MSYKIIGITGNKKHGKTEVAKIVQKHLQGTVIINFADAVKEEIAQACGVTVKHIDENKDMFRPILQWWGTDFRRSQNVDYWIGQWLLKLKRKPEGTRLVIAADVRFLNEAAAIRYLNPSFQIWRVVRPMPSGIDKHQSETELAKIDDNLTIANAGTVEDLEKKIKELIHKI